MRSVPPLTGLSVPGAVFGPCVPFGGGFEMPGPSSGPGLEGPEGSSKGPSDVPGPPDEHEAPAVETARFEAAQDELAEVEAPDETAEIAVAAFDEPETSVEDEAPKTG